MVIPTLALVDHVTQTILPTAPRNPRRGAAQLLRVTAPHRSTVFYTEDEILSRPSKDPQLPVTILLRTLYNVRPSCFLRREEISTSACITLEDGWLLSWRRVRVIAYVRRMLVERK